MMDDEDRKQLARGMLRAMGETISELQTDIKGGAVDPAEGLEHLALRMSKAVLLAKATMDAFMTPRDKERERAQHTEALTRMIFSLARETDVPVALGALANALAWIIKDCGNKPAAKAAALETFERSMASPPIDPGQNRWVQ